jgi:hypothetical protein
MGERLEAEVVRVLERVGRDLLEPRRQGFIALDDARTQRFDVIAGRHGVFCLPGLGLGHGWSPDRFKFRTDIPRPRNEASIEQNFHLLKRTKISFYTVAGSSRSICRLITRPAWSRSYTRVPEGV